MPRVKLFDEYEVLDKAVNLFWRKGYYATSIQDLVDYLGVNRASLYDTYGGKKKLFERAFLHYQRSNANSITQFLMKHEDVRSGLKELFEIAIQQSDQDQDHKGCLVVNTTIEFIPNEKEFFSLLSENKKEFEGMFHSYLMEGVVKGQISENKNLRAIASLLFAFYNGLKVVSKVDFDPIVYSQSVDSLLEILD